MKEPAGMLLERHRVGVVRSRVRVAAWPERCGGQHGRSLPRSALGSEVRPEVDALDLQSAALLCEAAYRTHFSEQELRGHMASVRVLLSEAAVGDLSVHSAGGQRYVVSHSPGAVYVAFQGTKHITDWATNLRLRHAPLWGGDCGGRDEHLAAHCGFSRRSMALPLLELRDAARAAGKRLILCGHSLGGAVAMLSAVTLLRATAAEATGAPRARPRRGEEDPFADDPQIRCVTFAAPPVANEALAAEVAAAGWDRYISNFVLPEDPVVPMINRLMRAGEGLDGSSDGDSGDGGNAQGGSEDSGATSTGQTGTEALQALGGATAVAAAARAVAHLLPLHLLLHAPAAAAAEVSDTAGWCDWDDGDALVDPSVLLPHGAATSLASTVAALGPAALAGQGVRARSTGGGSAGGAWGPLQLHGRRAHRLIRWAHDPRLAGQLRRHYQHQHAPPRQRPQPPPSWRPRPQGATQAHAAVAARGVGWEVARLLLTKQVDVAVPQQAVVKGRPNSSSSPVDQPGGSTSNGGGPAAAIEAARAWMSRALAGGLLRGDALRAAAMSAPRLLPALTRGAAPLIGRLLPAAVGLDVLAAAVVAAVVPRTCPIGSQWVLTHQGPEPADRPISDYPQQPHALGLRELGGLFPGHRMVSYRNRVAQLGYKRRGVNTTPIAKTQGEEALPVGAAASLGSIAHSSGRRSSLGGAIRRSRRSSDTSSVGGGRPGSRRGSRSSDAGDGDGGSGPQSSLTPQLSPA